MDATKTDFDINSNGQTAIEAITANEIWYSEPINTDGWYEAIIKALHGRTVTTAPSAGTIYAVEFSMESSGDGDWSEYTRQVTGNAAAESEAVNTAAAAATLLEMTSTTNLVAGELIYIKNTTLDNSEWRRIKSVSGSPVGLNLKDAIVNAQGGSATIYDQAEEVPFYINVGSIKRIRVRIENSSQAIDTLIKGIAFTANE